MNILPFINTREDHIALTWIWRAIRRGAFPVAFAELWAGSGVEQRKLIKIGAEIEKILTGRGDNDTKGNRLGRLAVRVAEFSVATSMVGRKSSETALAELESDPNWLADMTFPATRDHKLPVSITDLRDTIRYGMAAHGRLRDWLLPDEIEKLREGAATKLARFLGVADMRGMSVSQVESRARDRLSESEQRGAPSKSRPKRAKAAK